MIDRLALAHSARLFNQNLYFEAHDALEDLWSAERGNDRAFLQALVHLAVGMVHVSNENHQGAVNVLSRACGGLEPYAPMHRGLDVQGLIGSARACLRKSQEALAGIPAVWEASDRPIMRLAESES